MKHVCWLLLASSLSSVMHGMNNFSVIQNDTFYDEQQFVEKTNSILIQFASSKESMPENYLPLIQTLHGYLTTCPDKIVDKNAEQITATLLTTKITLKGVHNLVTQMSKQQDSTIDLQKSILEQGKKSTLCKFTLITATALLGKPVVSPLLMWLMRSIISTPPDYSEHFIDVPLVTCLAISYCFAVKSWHADNEQGDKLETLKKQREKIGTILNDIQTVQKLAEAKYQLFTKEVEKK